MVGVVAAAVTVPHPVAASSDAARCGGYRITLMGTARKDTLRGTSRRDVIEAGAGADRLSGLGGNDVLCGGSGEDVVVGGGGFDVLIGGKGADRIYGQEGSDDLVGGKGGDALDGGEGRDTLFPVSGNDVLRGGNGSDTFVSGPDKDTIQAGAGSHDLLIFQFSRRGIRIDLTKSETAGAGGDVLSGIEDVAGSAGADVLLGNKGENTLIGGAGGDTLAGKDGFDLIFGGPGDDWIRGDEGFDKVSYVDAQHPVDVDLADGTAAGAGTDVVSEIEVVFGSNFDDSIQGSDGANHLFGRRGDDELFGIGGSDALYGDFGSDILDGGFDDDKCERGDTLISCETEVTVERSPGTYITNPHHGSRIPARNLQQIRGRGYNTGFGAVDRARLAIRHLTRRGCRWWNSDRSRLELRPCEKPRWFRVQSRNTCCGIAWRYNVSGTLPTGFYTSMSQGIRRTEFRERRFESGRNLVDFQLVQPKE